MIGIVFSSFDLLHAGHLSMLREASEHCDYLIAGLQTDPTIDRPDIKNKPVQTLVERYVQLNAIKYVDEIIPYQTEADVCDILELYELDIRFLGSEYRTMIDYTGYDICRHRDIKIYYTDRDHRFSTTNLCERINGNNTRK